jgi:hypothetical protein
MMVEFNNRETENLWFTTFGQKKPSATKYSPHETLPKFKFTRFSGLG